MLKKLISTQASKRIGVFGSSFKGREWVQKSILLVERLGAWSKFEHKTSIGSTSKSIKSPISLRQVIKTQIMGS